MISIKFDDFSGNYDLFVKLCEMTSEPVKLVRDGSPDLVVMTADAFDRRKKVLDLKEKLLHINEDEPIDTKSISLDELSKFVDEIESGDDKK